MKRIVNLPSPDNCDAPGSAISPGMCRDYPTAASLAADRTNFRGCAADGVTPGRACAMTRRKETARREPALRRQQPAQRPGRARPVRRVRRPLRGRDADAADPGGRAGLSRRARRSGVPDGAGRLSEELCRPAQRAVVRRAADPAPRRREGLLQARRAEPHRQPQGQQLHGPDPAGQADGQDADHRRDRRRPARRGDRDDVRAVRAAVHRLHGCHRRRRGRRPTCSA